MINKKLSPKLLNILLGVGFFLPLLLGFFFEPIMFYSALALAVIFIILILRVANFWNKKYIWLIISASFILFAVDSLLCCINLTGKSFENNEQMQAGISPILQEVANELEYGGEYDCDDYAREFFLKCKSKGIKSAVVTSKSLQHAFNAVKLGKEWILIEPQSFENGYQNIYSVNEANDYSLMSYRFANTENAISVRLPIVAIPFWYAGWAIYEYVPAIFNWTFHFIPFDGIVTLQSIAGELNKECPVKLSDDITLKICEASDDILTYIYELQFKVKDYDFSTEAAQQALAGEKEEFLNLIKNDSNVTMLNLLKNGKIIQRRYIDMDNKTLYEISLSKSDL